MRINIKNGPSFEKSKAGLVKEGSFWGGRSITLYGQKFNRASLINALNSEYKRLHPDSNMKLQKGIFGSDKKHIKAIFDAIYCRGQSTIEFKPSVTDWLNAEEEDFLSKAFENTKINPLKVKLEAENHPAWENPSLLKSPVWSRIPRREEPYGYYKLLIPLTFTKEHEKSESLRCFVTQQDGEWRFFIDNFAYRFEDSFVKNLLKNGEESKGSRTWKLDLTS